LPHLWFLNGSFDLQFAAGDLETHRGYFDEMTAWFVPVAQTGDRVILDCQVPADYGAYLSSCGLDVGPATIVDRSFDAHGFAAVPWGWNSEAADLFKACGATVDAPDLEIVQEVNSRVFSFDVGRIYGYGVPGSRLFTDAGEAVLFIRSLGEFPWVIKPAFGSSGIGFLVIRSADDVERACARAASLLVSGLPALVIEPWIHRISDISSRFDLDRSGSIGSPEHYSTIVTSNGAFYGMGDGPDHASVAPRQSQLDRVAENVGLALHQKGYFGPVSIDSMVVRNEHGGETLVPLLEINARQGMSLIALALRDRLAVGRWWRFRSVGAKRISLPPDYDGWRALLGPNAYDPKSKSGIMIITPLRITSEKGARMPHRTIFFLSSTTAEGLDELDRTLTGLVRSPHLGRDY
jgi:hypothetical protein